MLPGAGVSDPFNRHGNHDVSALVAPVYVSVGFDYLAEALRAIDDDGEAARFDELFEVPQRLVLFHRHAGPDPLAARHSGPAVKQDPGRFSSGDTLNLTPKLTLSHPQAAAA
jgi:hypothetical protein